MEDSQTRLPELASASPGQRTRKSIFCDQHICNRITARIIPVLLIGAAGFATWVFIAQICVNFLIKKHSETGLGAGLITIYLVLFLLMSSCFFRIVLASPGYVPRTRDDPEKNSPPRPDPTVTADMFVCESGGYPRWCRTCEVIKPDRAHHSRDAGRCVYKMDHFCPWVGGMVGFTRYKFFLQFVTYTGLFCLFIVASVAPLMNRRLNESNSFPTPWLVTLILGAFFALFMIPFSITHIHYTLKNISTNESFDHKYRTYLFNVLVPTDNHQGSPSALSQQSVASQNLSSSTRVVVSTELGDPHPWDLGWRRNWTQVMGDKAWDWFLPIRGSQGDGIRFEYNEVVAEKLRTKARRIARAQSAITSSTAGSYSVAGSRSIEEKASTLIGSDQHV